MKHFIAFSIVFSLKAAEVTVGLLAWVLIMRSGVL